MPEIKDAVAALTDPRNVTEKGVAHPRPMRAVKHARVVSQLRKDGAGKAEARQLALQALAEIDGEVEEHPKRAGQGREIPGGDTVEDWWIPADRIRW